IGEVIAVAAGDYGLECRIATAADEFLDALVGEECLIMLDLVLPETDGIELLRHLRRHECRAPIVLMSGFDKRVLSSAEQLAHELGLRVLGRLLKPFRLNELSPLFEAAVALHEEDVRPRRRAAARATPEELLSAIEQDEFVLHYQPQIDLATG